MENLWNEKEYAGKRGFSVSSAQKERHFGNGPPYIKIGRLVRYRPEDVRAFVASHVVNSTSEAA